MDFFDHKDLGNHLLQLCPKVVKHSVYIYHVCVFAWLRTWSFWTTVQMTENLLFSSVTTRIWRRTVAHDVTYRNWENYTTRKKHDCEKEKRQNGKQRKEQRKNKEMLKVPANEKRETAAVNNTLRFSFLSKDSCNLSGQKVDIRLYTCTLTNQLTNQPRDSGELSVPREAALRSSTQEFPPFYGTWRFSQSQGQNYFSTGCLPPISSSWHEYTWGSRPGMVRG
jgi:hypothetical protein